MALIGQPISDVISIRDDAFAPVLGLTAGDFAVLEAYAITAPGTTAVVTLAEINQGQYRATFTPTVAGAWALHSVYSDDPVFIDETRRYEVDATSTVTINATGGTWTYAGDFNVPRDVVRYLLQDTDSTNPLLTDAEIAYELGRANDDAHLAALGGVRRLITRYAGMTDVSELDLSVKASQLFDHYTALEATLLADTHLAAIASAVPFAGGVSVADVDTRNANRDRTVPAFARPFGRPWRDPYDWRCR